MASTESLAFATQTIDIATNPSAGETVVVGPNTYTFVASPASANDVDIGANAEGTLDNLRSAILADGTVGAYEPGTVRDAVVGRVDKVSATQLKVLRCRARCHRERDLDLGNHGGGRESGRAANFVGGSGDLKLFMEDVFNLNKVNVIQGQLFSRMVFIGARGATPGGPYVGPGDAESCVSGGKTTAKPWPLW